MSMKLQLCVNILVFTIFSQFINICESISCNPPSKTVEGRLKQRLLCNNYNKEIRPITASQKATIVNIAAVLNSFDAHDNSDQLFVNLWIAMKWRDDKLKWNKGEFDNTTSIIIPSSDIWNPEILIYYEDSLKTDKPCKDTHCIIDSDGLVTCIPVCKHMANCDTDYKYWPYDIQTCEFKIGNWLHKDSEVQFKPEKVTDYKNSFGNSYWNIISFKTKNLKGSYSWSTDETFPAIKYTIIIQRNFMLTETYIIIPSLVLCFFNLMVLWLKPDSFDRTILIIISVYSHFCYMSIIMFLVPVNGGTSSKAVMYFRNSCIVTVILLFDMIYKRALLISKSNIPPWIKTATTTIASNKIWQLLFSHPNSISTNSSGQDNNKVKNDSSEVKQEGKKDQVSWSLVVQVLDVVTFLILVIVYISLIFGWIPISRNAIKKIELAVN